MTSTDTRGTEYEVLIPQLHPGEPITTVQSLADHLWVAAKVELSTIPLYLYTAYSIKTKGYSQWAPQQGALRTIIGVAIEEMLHLCLVRNLLAAIGYGDAIRFYDEKFVPAYPHNMLNRFPDLPLHLSRLSSAHVGTFVELEAPDDVPEIVTIAGDKVVHPERVGQYTSLGAFYRAIEEGFERLDGKELKWRSAEDKRWVDPGVEKQYLRGFWNQFGTGKPLRVCDLPSALKALNIIIEQGEGSATDHERTRRDPNAPEHSEEVFTHWWKFVRIQHDIEGIGAYDGLLENDISIDSPRVVWPVVDDPKLAVHGEDNPRISSLMNLFNAAYCYLLGILDELYHTSTTDVRKERIPGTDRVELFSHRYCLERNTIAAMQGILYPVAELMVRTPLMADADPNTGPNIGPSFEYYQFGKLAATRKAELTLLCEQAIRYFPELGGDDSVRRQISLLVDLPGQSS